MNWFLRLFAKKENPQKRVDGQMPPFRSRMSPPLNVSACSAKSSYKSGSDQKRSDNFPVDYPSFFPINENPISSFESSPPVYSHEDSPSQNDFGGGSFGGGGSSDSWSDSGSSSSDSGSSSFSD